MWEKLIVDFILTEERITWEEFNIYGADAGPDEASSDSQDGNNESPR